jgi:DNA repair exonuclease SbcCD ATPase subunit
MNSKELKDKLNRKLGERDVKLHEYNKCISNIKDYKKNVITYENAITLVNTLAQEIQTKLQYHISDLSSSILQSVFEEDYEVILEFVKRRGKTEADIKIKKNGFVMNPKDSASGGERDLISFALRLVSWSLQKPKSRNVMLLDEVFKNLSVEYQDNAGEMLKEISSKLGVQIIMITHKEKLIEHADKVFNITMKDNISKVEEYEL